MKTGVCLFVFGIFVLLKEILEYNFFFLECFSHCSLFLSQSGLILQPQVHLHSFQSDSNKPQSINRDLLSMFIYHSNLFLGCCIGNLLLSNTLSQNLAA